MNCITNRQAGKGKVLPRLFNLTMLLFFFSWQITQAQETNPRLSINIPATTLDVALRLLEQQSKVTFSYENTRVRSITIKARHFTDASLETILKEILEDTKMTFLRKNGNILIVPRPKQPGTLSGYVEDQASGERLIGVSLAVPEFQAGTTSNNFGFFSITLPADSIRIRLSYMGYQRVDTMIELKNDTRLNFKLVPDNRLLDVVTVRASREERIQESSQMSMINLPASQIAAMPRFFGEADLLKTLQLLPGVKQGTEGTSALLVRGGTPDQNLILLDGAPLYNPSHLLGIFSTFNTSALKDVTLYKGAFPARYGGRLSSVVDVSTKDGDMRELHGDFTIGLLASQITVEGPIKKDKTSFIVSGRRTYTDLVARPFIKGSFDREVDKFIMYFYDVNAKVQHVISDKDRLFFSLYHGRDKMRVSEKLEVKEPDNYRSESDLLIQWGNTTSTVRWNHIFSKNLFANTMLLGSRYEFKTRTFNENLYQGEMIADKLQLNSGIQDYGAKIDFDYRPRPAHTIRMGTSYMFRLFTPGTIRQSQTANGAVIVDSTSDNQRIKGSEIDLYAEDDWTIHKKFKLNAGLHWSGFLVQGRFYNSLQPRLSMRYLLPGDWGLKASYSRMTQYIHLLANNSVTLPTDLWVPATKRILPQQSDQYAIGIARNVFRNKFELSVEGYYKRMQNVIEYKEGADYITSSRNESWQDQVTNGVGEAYGLEVLLQKKTGRFTGWMAYTLAWSYRTLPEVNFGKKFPYKYDRRHDLHLVGMYKLRKNIELTGVWTYQSAQPYTVPLAEYEVVRDPVRYPGWYGTNADVEYINGRNNVRIAAYHRLDLGVNFIRQKRNGNVRTWNISVLNAYNKKNAFYYLLNRYRADQTEATLTGTTLLPIMPSFSYNLKF
ncbi:TonB-dependent receptor domain-containing protein [Chitinophaga sp. SYP-B3965]|uniref:TonB-dependent receptor domain-containing protein n=1 Tax=Chitinophaga sp. SYP-B3965 TaxID=2663120 RepID=UPI0020A66F4B|nr:TonB-dependent receptor [Chitinophaga sp. SYP-B3965]